MRETLWERSEGRCMRCGAPLRGKEQGVVEFSMPPEGGGEKALDGFRLVCAACHGHRSGGPWATERSFEAYIHQMLLRDERFEDVRANERITTADGQGLIFDLSFSQAVNGRKIRYVIEAKCFFTATVERVQAAIRQMERYRQACPDARFILAVPVMLAETYRELVRAAGFTLWDAETLRLGIPDGALPAGAAPDRYDELIDRLRHCQPGLRNWQVYQKLVGEILEALFCPPLDHVSEQNADADRRNRRDFVIPNYTDSGLWWYLRHAYRADFVVVDAKNGAQEIGKDDILQVAHYLKEKGAGLFGLIFSRRGTGKSAEAHLRDVWLNENKMIVVLDDSDVEQMLLSRQGGDDPSRMILARIQEFRLKI